MRMNKIGFINTTNKEHLLSIQFRVLLKSYPY